MICFSGEAGTKTEITDGCICSKKKYKPTWIGNIGWGFFGPTMLEIKLCCYVQ